MTDNNDAGWTGIAVVAGIIAAVATVSLVLDLLGVKA